MKDNFDLRKFLSENKLTSNSRQLNEDIYGGQFDDDYGSNDGSSLYGGNVPPSHDDSEYISQLVKDTVTHFEREVTVGNLEPEDITLKMIKGTAGVDSKVAKQIAIEIEDLFNLMPATIKEEEEEDQEGDDYNYDVTEEVEVGMRVVDAENDLFEVTEVTPTRITLEPVGYEGENVYFPEDFGKDVNIEDFWFHLEEQEEERTGMFGEPSDSDEWGSGPF